MSVLPLDSILQECRQAPTGVWLIVAPTGTGKTTGVCGLVREHPEVFGVATIVQPTRMAARATGADAVPPGALMERFLRTKSFGCDTLVLDEAHAPLVEYNALFSFLWRTNAAERMRVILMTATPDAEHLRGFFPDMRTRSLDVAPPYPTTVYYEPIPNNTPFPPASVMASHTTNVLRKYVGHDKVLVFVYTHEQCERMARELKTVVEECNGGKVFALHGGVDLTEWNRFMRQETRFVVVATNAAEASVTIPGLSLVVDFGVRCVQRNHRIVYNHCPRSNLIQRAGRVGRTCPGVVVRCMTEPNFHERPIQDTPSHNWDLVVLRVLWHGHNPEALLPETLDVGSTTQKLRFYGLMRSDGSLDRGLTSFVLRCPLSFKNSCHLSHFLSLHKRQADESLLALYVLSCVLIDQVETRVSRVYYYSHEMKISRQRFTQKLRRLFDPPDELFFHLHLVLSCLLHGSPVQFSNAFSLNFRTIRQVGAGVERLWRFLGQERSWKDAVRGTTFTRMAPGLRAKETRFEVCRVEKAYVEALRRAYFLCPHTPRMLLINDMIWRPNLVLESYNCVISPFIQAYGRNRCVLILSHDDTDVEKWSDTSATLTDITTLSFSLYTYPPTPVDVFVHDLHGAVREGCFEHNMRRKNKEVVRKRFDKVVRDVREDVAFRPGFWAALESIDVFVRSMDEKKKSTQIIK